MPPPPIQGRPRLGLCCLFREAPIRFVTTTATALARRTPAQRARRLAELCRANAEALAKAVAYCADHGIGAFRINSQILPLKTHPALGYALDRLPDGAAIQRLFRAAGRLARTRAIRLSFHPDQFVVLNALRPEVLASSRAELDYQTEVAGWVGADVINLHGGGVYGDKAAALDRLQRHLDALPERLRKRITLENDDRLFTPADLLPVCRATGIPLVYDVHHHRCLPDGRDVADLTRAAWRTWDREPLFHLSSPRDGWGGPHPERHHDYIDPADFPREWRHRKLTVDIEAKAKELAIGRLQTDLGWPTRSARASDSADPPRPALDAGGERDGE
jgi:UV DNA damage endonuclease